MQMQKGPLQRVGLRCIYSSLLGAETLKEQRIEYERSQTLLL